MQSQDSVLGRSEALTFLFAAIRGFQKTFRTIFEDAVQICRKSTDREEYSADEHSVDSAPAPSVDDRHRPRRAKHPPPERDS
jgi:hypothetical protein